MRRIGTILVVDDDINVREMLQNNLELSGYKVLTAKNGEEGLRVLSEYNPKIVLLDLNMPVMGGVDFLRNLSSTFNRTHSIIVLTGYGTDQEIKKCYQLGIQSFLRKPVNWYELEGLIHRNIELLDYSEKLEEQIEERERINNLLKSTLDGIAEGIIALDRQFHIKMISQKACQILKIDENEALNKSAAAVLGAKVAGPGGLLLSPTKSTEVTDIHTELISASGHVIPVYLSTKAIERGSASLEQLIFLRDLRTEQSLLRDKAGGIVFGKMISGNSRMNEVFSLIDNVAASNATVLIQGESGTGKELVAKEIHARSTRARNSFHVVNCAAISANLLEAEFFGHQKGSFTGAHKTKKGRFELADKGTLFLDEIAEIPLDLQVKLLRALQEQKFERVGGTETINVDVRIVAATNQQLDQLVSQQKFREDLFYRLDVVKIDLPALRDRMTDIPLLVGHFIERLNKSEDRHVKDLSPNAFQSLFSYNWPGNVRELYHSIEHGFAISKGDVIRKSHLPSKITAGVTKKVQKSQKPKSEKEAIQIALQESGYHKGKAASLLGISYVTLYRKIKKYSISY